jgi:hypothetical protein
MGGFNLEGCRIAADSNRVIVILSASTGSLNV